MKALVMPGSVTFDPNLGGSPLYGPSGLPSLDDIGGCMFPSLSPIGLALT